MKLENVLNGTSVDVKAKHAGDQRYNKEATQHFLNYVSLLATEAANRWDELGCKAIAKEARDFGSVIYKMLEEQGLYK